MRMHEVLGIERGVLTQSSQYKEDNRAVLDALARGAPHLRAIVFFHAEHINDKLLADLDPKGAVGIRIHHEEFGELEAISERIADAGWRVEIVPPSIEVLVELRPTFERMRCGIMVDQMGLPDASKGVEHPTFQAVLSMVRDGLIWVKLSHPYHGSRQGPPYDDILPFAQALVDANAAQCVWGTNWPHGQKRWRKDWERPQDGKLLDLLVKWVPDEATRNRILVDNPAKLNRF
jgi:predicted TIM-barrel fold metal-dependent hydrolase